MPDFQVPMSLQEANDFIQEFVARHNEANARNASVYSHQRAAESRLWLTTMLMGGTVSMPRYAIRKWTRPPRPKTP